MSESTFGRRLADGSFVVTAEITPPRDGDAEPFRRRLAALAPYVDALNVTDNPGASIHASSLAGAAVAVQSGIAPIVQLTCRNKNRVALLSDAIGAWLIGAPAVLALTGDPPANAATVEDFDSFALIAALRDLRDEGRLIDGRQVANPPRLLIGAVEAPFAGTMSSTVDRLERKIAAGADFVQTQFVYDVPAFAAWMAEVRSRGLHRRAGILAGVGPIRGLRSVQRLQALTGGIPDWLAERLAVDDPEAAGLDVAVETIAALRSIEGVAGIHLMPLQWPDGVRRTVEAARLRAGER